MLLHSSSGCRFHIFAHADCYFRTKFPLFHMPAEREAFNLEIDTQSMSWNHIHKYRNGLCVTFLNYYTAIGKLFQEENDIHMKILTTDLMIDYIIFTLKWRNKVMYFIPLFDVVFQTLPLITDSKSFLSINYTPFLLISFILIYIFFVIDRVMYIRMPQ